MGTHPVNLALRFLLELLTLLSAGYWGWKQYNGLLQWVVMLGLPLLLAAIWGTFAVPGDPSRSGNAPIPTPGTVRLILELAFFALGSWAMHRSGFEKSGWIFMTVVLIHYLISYDRIVWLLKQG